MRHPGKLKKRCADKIRKKYTPLSQVGELLRRHAQHPGLLKWMEKSHVSGGFYLALHTPFCREHLPEEDTIMLLETKEGHRYESKYLVRPPCGLSGGWRRFALDMKLEHGDGVVFHLVAPTKFKVYFIRSKDEALLPFHHLINLVIQPRRSALSKKDLQEKQKVCKADKFWSKVFLIPQRNLKKLYADKIRRKYLPFFQVSRICNLVEARRVQSELNDEHPPVVVQWLKNWNVFHHPSLVLPRPFCTAHLAKVVATMMLETETGERYEAKYLPHVRRLSAGWIMFARKMNLREGDAVVFHLVEPAKFKVYVVRANSTKEVRLPFHLLKLVLHSKRSISSAANTSPLSFFKARQVYHRYLQGKQKVLRANKIWSKKSNEVLGRCHLDHGKRIQPNLNTEHLVTMKRLFKSNVSTGFYVTLPSAYCKAYLPLVDTIMLLETENGEQYEAKYLPRLHRLSGGWRRFAKNMKLEEGDVVIFHLVEAAKFKVYIIRADEVKLLPHIHDSVNLLRGSISSKAESNQLTVYRSWKVHQKNLHGVQKESKACTIWRKSLRRFQLGQVLRNSHLIQSELNARPITVRWLLQSNISGGFSLPLPTQFCSAFLPSDDTTMALETENGEKYETTYLAQCSSLTGGWRRFAMDKKLEAGDAVIFHLVEATKFKVYIIRANSIEVHIPVHLLRLLTYVGRRISCKASKPLIVYSRRKEHQISETGGTKKASLKFTEGSVLFPQRIQFSSIRSFEEFRSILHELHDELPNNELHEYYKLCCSQNAFLHAQLFRGINPRLNTQTTVDAIKRIILNTVNLAYALSTCKLSTFLHEYALWDKTLKTYEALGMNVGFLCARLHHLKNLAVSLEGATDRIRYEEAYHERGRAKCEARKLQLMLDKLKSMQTLKLNLQEINHRDVCSWLEYIKAEISYLENTIAELGQIFAEYDAHIVALKLKAKIHAQKFSEEVSTPWLDCSSL